MRGGGETQLLAAAQLLVDGRPLLHEYARIDQHLWWIALGLYAGGAVLLSGVLVWAYRRLRGAHQQLADRTARLLRANHELSLAASTSAGCVFTLRLPAQLFQGEPAARQPFASPATKGCHAPRSEISVARVARVARVEAGREICARRHVPVLVAYATKVGRVVAVVLVLGSALSSFAASLSLPPLWRWSNPAPHGANIVDQATVGPLTVQVGERGQIFLSDDWRVWTPHDSGTMLAFRGATFFNGRLVITGESGAVMVADNPWDFYGMLLGTSDWLESVAASEQRVVAVGDNGAIYTSTNAVNWTRLSPPFSTWLRGVAYGAKVFVAVGEQGTILTSGNGGTNWIAQTSGTTNWLMQVRWLHDRLVAVGAGGTLLTALTALNGAPTRPAPSRGSMRPITRMARGSWLATRARCWAARTPPTGPALGPSPKSRSTA